MSKPWCGVVWGFSAFRHSVISSVSRSFPPRTTPPYHSFCTKLTPTHSRCPGTHLVESSVWLLITSMLATLDIRKARDEKGVEIEPVVKFENAVFRTPSPFMCDIRPRSEEALRLIMEGE